MFLRVVTQISGLLNHDSTHKRIFKVIIHILAAEMQNTGCWKSSRDTNIMGKNPWEREAISWIFSPLDMFKYYLGINYRATGIYRSQSDEDQEWKKLTRLFINFSF